MKLFVGNLSFEVRDEDLRSAFEPFGRVESAAIVRERGSSVSRGFGFVEMPSRTEAQSAIEAMNGKELMGRSLSVNEARPMPERTGGGGGGGSRSGGFSRHKLDTRRRDGSRRKSGSRKGGQQRFNKRSF